MNILIYVVVCMFFIVLLIVGIYNSADITLDMVFWQLGPAPLGAVIAAAAIFGVAFTCAIGVIDGIKIRITNRQLRRQVNRLEEEADSLRLKLARHEGPVPPVVPEEAAQAAPESPIP
jgi:uncharacterized integral membrane protein